MAGDAGDDRDKLTAVMAEPPELLLPDAGAWRSWLADHHHQQDGVRLVLGRKSPGSPTALRYDDALAEALCFGWIDGRINRRDQHSYFQRFTPRRARSPWSQRNVGLAEALMGAGRMAPSGLAEVERAKADGRWQAAYAGAATIEVPEDLRRALDANPAASATFAQLTGQNRYAILYRLQAAKRPETRRRRLDQYVGMLVEGRTLHPQARTGGSDPAPTA